MGLNLSEEDIAATISYWTGIPVSKMLEDEADRLLRVTRECLERGIAAIAAAVWAYREVGHAVELRENLVMVASRRRTTPN